MYSSPNFSNYTLMTNFVSSIRTSTLNYFEANLCHHCISSVNLTGKPLNRSSVTLKMLIAQSASSSTFSVERRVWPRGCSAARIDLNTSGGNPTSPFILLNWSLHEGLFGYDGPGTCYKFTVCKQPCGLMFSLTIHLLSSIYISYFLVSTTQPFILSLAPLIS